jgi:hypothetical protein
VKNRFQHLPFKFNLQRYSAVATAAAADGGGVGRCTLPPPDPWLKGAWYPVGFNLAPIT